MRAAWQLVVGLWCVAIMVLRAKGGPRGPYWSWRTETAFGIDRSVSRRTKLEATKAYSRWVALTRRL